MRTRQTLDHPRHEDEKFASENLLVVPEVDRLLTALTGRTVIGACEVTDMLLDLRSLAMAGT